MISLFISDLHLDESRPAVTAEFFRFLEREAAAADALYILGDFFEVWIGDDDDAPLALAVIAKLRQLVDGGTRLYLMHGNRDFLYGDDFCRASGATLLQDPTPIELAGQTTLLMHGDSLCTDDSEYMAFRAQSRSAPWQQQMLSQPLAARRQLAANLRQQSKSMSALKAEDIMDVNAQAVAEVMAAHGAQRLIHGHTHRPARHDLGAGKERLVLGDWGDKAWCIKAGDNALELIEWDIGQ